MAETDPEKAVPLRRHQPPAAVDVLSVEETGLLTINICKTAVGVEFSGLRRNADETAQQPGKDCCGVKQGFHDGLKLGVHPLGDFLIRGGHLRDVLLIGILHFVEQTAASCLVTLIGAAKVKTDASRVSEKTFECFSVPGAVVRFEESLVLPINACGVG